MPESTRASTTRPQAYGNEPSDEDDEHVAPGRAAHDVRGEHEQGESDDEDVDVRER